MSTTSPHHEEHTVDIPDTMSAIIQRDSADPSSLELGQVATPQPGPGEVLVKVAAAGVNRADLLQAQGHYPPPKGASDIIGLEVAGTIVALGPDTPAQLQLGERVGALLAGGGYAEYVAVPAGQLTPIPQGWSLTDTAAIIEVATTVWSNLVMEAQLQPGELVLIHGGAGGIGTHAIQVAKALGATVAVTAGSAEKLDLCRRLGADITINYREEDFAEELAGRCNVIVDIIGAKYLKQNLRALAPEGRMVTIGLQGGTKAELNMGLMLAKRLRLQGTTLRSRPVAAKAEIVSHTVANIWPWLADGTVSHHIHQVLPLSQAATAHELLASGQVSGTLVLEVAPAD